MYSSAEHMSPIANPIVTLFTAEQLLLFGKVHTDYSHTKRTN